MAERWGAVAKKGGALECYGNNAGELERCYTCTGYETAVEVSLESDPCQMNQRFKDSQGVDINQGSKNESNKV